MKTVTTPQFTLKKLQSDFPAIKITECEHSQKFIRQFYGDDLEVFESFFILLLNRSNTTIGYAKISQGGINGTYVDPKMIAKYCLDSMCNGVILAHNHPSGNLNPSEQDLQMTKKIKKVLDIIEVQLLDHIILTKDSFTSMRNEGII